MRKKIIHNNMINHFITRTVSEMFLNYKNSLRLYKSTPNYKKGLRYF